MLSAAHSMQSLCRHVNIFRALGRRFHGIKAFLTAICESQMSDIHIDLIDAEAILMAVRDGGLLHPNCFLQSHKFLKNDG